MINLSGRKIGVLFSYVLMTVQIASGLLFTPFVIRSLGQAEYGVYSLTVTITAYFALLDLGVGNALVKYMAQYRAEGNIEAQRKFVGLSLIFYSAICVLMFVLSVLLQHNLAYIFGKGLTSSELSLLGHLLLFTIASSAVTMITSVFSKVMVAYEFFALSNIFQIVQIVLRIVIQMALLFCGFRALVIVASNLVLTVLLGFATAYFVISKIGIKPSFSNFDWSFIKEVFGYTTFIFIQMVATQINAMADQIILGIMSSSLILGVYAVGAQLNQYFQSVASGVNGVTMPGFVKMVANGATPSEIQNEMVKVGRILLIIIGIVMGGFIVTGKLFITLWAGSENVNAYLVAVLLMLPQTFSLIQSSGTQVLWAKEKHQLQAYIKIVVAVLNLGLTVLLVKWSPLVGAALGTAISCFLGDIVAMNLAFSKCIGIKMASYYHGLMSGILPSILIASLAGLVLLHFLSSTWGSFFFTALIILTVYYICLRSFGFDEYEKSLVIGVARSFSRR